MDLILSLSGEKYSILSTSIKSSLDRVGILNKEYVVLLPSSPEHKLICESKVLECCHILHAVQLFYKCALKL